LTRAAGACTEPFGRISWRQGAAFEDIGYQHDQLADRLKCCPISSALEGADLFRNLTAAAPGKELLPHLREARTALFAIEKVE
jgi:hypothetical protein